MHKTSPWIKCKSRSIHYSYALPRPASPSPRPLSVRLVVHAERMRLKMAKVAINGGLKTMSHTNSASLPHPPGSYMLLEGKTRISSAHRGKMQRGRTCVFPGRVCRDASSQQHMEQLNLLTPDSSMGSRYTN